MRASLLCFALLLSACRGELVAKAELSGPGTTTLQLTPPERKRLALWTDFDAVWTGGKSSKPDLTYVIEVSQGGQLVGTSTCSTRAHAGASVCGVHSNIMGKHDADCEVELECKLPRYGAGPLDVKVTGSTGGNVKSVKLMNLMFRED